MYISFTPVVGAASNIALNTNSRRITTVEGYTAALVLMGDGSTKSLKTVAVTGKSRTLFGTRDGPLLTTNQRMSVKM
jgi:hypothetical protein